MGDNLLDTHTFLWFIEGDKKLSAKAKKLIEAGSSNNFISIASLWEIAIKLSLKKLELKASFSVIAELIANNGFTILPITFEDTLLVSQLPFYHSDPFDRIIISQSITNHLTLLSKDKQFDNYNIKRVW